MNITPIVFHYFTALAVNIIINKKIKKKNMKYGCHSSKYYYFYWII